MASLDRAEKKGREAEGKRGQDMNFFRYVSSFVCVCLFVFVGFLVGILPGFIYPELPCI